MIERDGLVLATLRGPGMSMPGKWEFPGGKLDGAETPRECLGRELKEELSVRVQVRHPLPTVTHAYPHFVIRLYPFICTLEAGEVHLHEHADALWLRPGELPGLDWAEADLPVLNEYLRQRLEHSEA